MRKLLKIFIYTVIGLVALLLIAGIVITQVIDPNVYKPLLSQQISMILKRQVDFKGAIKLSYFPALGLRAEDVQIAQPMPFATATPDFATVKTLDIRVKLLPLLQQQIEIDTVILDELTINLIRRADGSTNWDDLQSPPATSAATGESPTFSLALTGIELRNASIHLEEPEKKRFLFKALELKTGAILYPSLPPISINLSGIFNELGTFTLSTVVQWVGTETRLHLQPVNLSFENHHLIIPAIEFNGSQQSLAEMPFTVRLFDTFALQGVMQGKNLLSTPQLDLTLTVPNLNLRAVLARFGYPLPELNTQVFQHFALNATARFTPPTNLSLTVASLKLDDSTVNGQLQYQFGEKPLFNVDLQIDTLEVDRYLPKTTAPAAASNTGINSPFAILRNLPVKGKLQIQEIIFQETKLQEVVLHLE